MGFFRNRRIAKLTVSVAYHAEMAEALAHMMSRMTTFPGDLPEKYAHHRAKAAEASAELELLKVKP